MQPGAAGRPGLLGGDGDQPGSDTLVLPRRGDHGVQQEPDGYYLRITNRAG